MTMNGREKTSKVRKIKEDLDFTPPKVTKKDKVFAYCNRKNIFVLSSIIEIDFSSEVPEYTVMYKNKTFKTHIVFYTKNKK